MSTPDKTSENLDLAQAMNDNPSASGSNDDNAVSKANKSKQDDHSNANVSDMAKRLNEIDMAFRDSVITKESSSDFMDRAAEVQSTPLQQSTTGPSSSFDSDAAAVDSMPPKKNEADFVPPTTILKDDDDSLDQFNNDDAGGGAGLDKAEDAKDWKPEVGSVYDRVLKIQKTEPKKYVRKEKHEVENIQVLPEILNCPKCNRKVAAGAINYHVKFCNPDDADHAQ